MFDNLTEKQQALLEFINDKWKEKSSELEKAVDGGFCFAVQSDTHFSVTSNEKDALNLKALSHFIPIKFYANLGDYIKGYFKGEVGKIDNTPDKTMRSLIEITHRYLDDANCPVLITFGNHDTNQLWCKNYGRADQQLTQADHHEQVIAKIQAHNGSSMVADGDSNYYYVDFINDNIRVIMINTTDGCYESEFDSTSQISARQLDWFENVALNTSLSVVVMLHIPLIPEFPGNDGSKIAGGEKLLSAVEKFIADGGDFIAYFNGHTHNQADLTDENGRLHISFQNGGHLAEVVRIDTEKRTIETVGLGNENRFFNY